MAIDPSFQLGIEVGPLASPVVTKDMGDIAYIDHANTDELRKWYQDNPAVDLEKIVDVDHVWGEFTFEEAVGKDKKFDYVIASHVIEHVPDMIGWFNEVGTILKPNGILSLVIPDKRFTLDRLRRTSSDAELIGAYFFQLRKPSPRQIFDHFSLVVEVDAQKIWSGDCDDRQLRKLSTESLAFNACKDSIDHNRYFDSHCWVFTPDSFFRNLYLLIELGLFDFEVNNFFDTAKGEIEFFVTLRKTNDLQEDQKKKRHQLNSLPAHPSTPTMEELSLEGCLSRLEEQERIITKIRQSTSWRITAPLRKVSEKLKFYKAK